MDGMSERAYAAQAGLSRGAVQKAKAAGRLVLHADGSIDAAASDAKRAAATDPSKQRSRGVGRPRSGAEAGPGSGSGTGPGSGSGMNPGSQAGAGMKEVPESAVSSVGDTLKEQGMAAPASGGGTTFLQAKTAHEVLKAQERQTRLARLKGELVDRDRAKALVFRLAREERDAWVTWPARVAALMAAELSASSSEAVGQDVNVEAAAMQGVLEAHVRAHLDELAEPRIAF